jgi:hypothetical protein
MAFALIGSRHNPVCLGLFDVLVAHSLQISDARTATVGTTNKRKANIDGRKKGPIGVALHRRAF